MALHPSMFRSQPPWTSLHWTNLQRTYHREHQLAAFRCNLLQVECLPRCLLLADLHLDTTLEACSHLLFRPLTPSPKSIHHHKHQKTFSFNLRICRPQLAHLVQLLVAPKSPSRSVSPDSRTCERTMFLQLPYHKNPHPYFITSHKTKIKIT